MNIAAKETGRQSLHHRIMAGVKAKILSGEWPPGRRIPFEHELTEEYGCSRMTVNKALTQLARAGLIERRRKSGSFVRRPHSQSAVLEIRDIMTEVQSLGLPYRFEITQRAKRRAGRADVERLRLARPTLVLELACMHFAGARPFCLEERLINLSVAPEAAAEPFSNQAPGPWLVDRVPWSAAEHRIRAVGSSPAASAALGIAEGTPCLLVERSTWREDQPVTHVRLTYPGEGHELTAHFTPSEA